MKRTVIIMLLYLAVGGLGCSSLGGKVETSFTETVTDPEGFTTTTGYEAVSKAGEIMTGISMKTPMPLRKHMSGWMVGRCS